MGIQVDPYYGSDHDDERLYFRVANMSNEPIRLQRTDRVFNIEFHDVAGSEKAQCSQGPEVGTACKFCSGIREMPAGLT